MLTVSIENALNLIGIKAPLQPASLKQACRAALESYQPAEGLAAKRITRLLVQSYRALEGHRTLLPAALDPSYGERLSDAFGLVIAKQWNFELRGGWLWVFERGTDLKDALRACGFQWASRKGCWVLHPQSTPGRPLA